MPRIELLDQITIDKIAAGEVIERPASVVKELVENAIDAGASAISVEIEEGGIAMIRISDNGCGMEKEQVRSAFLRHSTSKIRSAEDLTHIGSLGFRGEALSSIAAVSQVELLTKTEDEILGTRYMIEGGREVAIEEVGASKGTSFFVRQLFYNTPARRKFLKTPTTEASHIGDLLTRLALSHPEISFHYINNRQSKLHTSGNGNLKDVIYHVYGREIAGNLLEVDVKNSGFTLKGFLGKPIISRGNRNFENYFVNGRYIKSSIVSKAIEDAYHDYTMQHKYPFVVFHLNLPQEEIDVNVHPTKMELRFAEQQKIYNQIFEAIREGLQEKPLIPEVVLPVTEKKTELQNQIIRENVIYNKPRPDESEEEKFDYFMNKMKERVAAFHNRDSHAEVFSSGVEEKKINALVNRRREAERLENEQKTECTLVKTEHTLENEHKKTEQLSLFDEKILTIDIKQEYKIVGQVFETYWLVEFQEQLYIIDQHAAHERVLYEKTLRGLKNRDYTSQYLSPPIILTLSPQEVEVFEKYKDRFCAIGYEIESFGGEEYAVRAVPDNLFGIAKKELLLEMIDELSDGIAPNTQLSVIDEKIASMSCKAAVKGNSKLSMSEVDSLIGELLQLENPYHCPHGRPTIIRMTKRELEKKFKRII